MQIVVGGRWERERTFEFEGDLPPFVFEEEYPAALERCKNMTDAEIDKLREDNVHWYIDRISSIKRKISLFLQVYPP